MWTEWGLTAQEEGKVRLLGVLQQNGATLLLVFTAGGTEDVLRAQTVRVGGTAYVVRECSASPIDELSREDRAILQPVCIPSVGTLCILNLDEGFPADAPQNVVIGLSDGLHERSVRPVTIPAVAGTAFEAGSQRFALEEIRNVEGAALVLYEAEESAQLRFVLDAPTTKQSGAIGVFLRPRNGKNGWPLQYAVLPCDVRELHSLTVTAVLTQETAREMVFCRACD